MDEDLFAGVVPFFHVAEEASFRKAAERLGVSTAAVSKSVAKLEERLGVKLLVRTSRAVALTPEGRTYLGSCREAIGQLRVGRELLSAARDQPEGEVHLSQSPILARTVVPAVPALLARHPRLTLTIATTDRVSRLAQDAVDVALRVGARADSALVSRTVLRPSWVTVASPGYLARRGTPTTVEALARHACLQFVGPAGRRIPWLVPRDGRTVPVDVDGPLRVDHGD
ncbi:MAG: LysR family transcriptional regulator, partial [Myxococcota bacterium]